MISMAIHLFWPFGWLFGPTFGQPFEPPFGQPFGRPFGRPFGFARGLGANEFGLVFTQLLYFRRLNFKWFETCNRPIHVCYARVKSHFSSLHKNEPRFCKLLQQKNVVHFKPLSVTNNRVSSQMAAAGNVAAAFVVHVDHSGYCELKLLFVAESGFKDHFSYK